MYFEKPGKDCTAQTVELALKTAKEENISTIVVALLWLYMSAVVLVMGAEFNGALLAEREQHAGQAEPGREETL